MFFQWTHDLMAKVPASAMRNGKVMWSGLTTGTDWGVMQVRKKSAIEPVSVVSALPGDTALMHNRQSAVISSAEIGVFSAASSLLLFAPFCFYVVWKWYLVTQ